VFFAVIVVEVFRMALHRDIFEDSDISPSKVYVYHKRRNLCRERPPTTVKEYISAAVGIIKCPVIGELNVVTLVVSVSACPYGAPMFAYFLMVFAASFCRFPIVFVLFFTALPDVLIPFLLVLADIPRTLFIGFFPTFPVFILLMAALGVHLRNGANHKKHHCCSVYYHILHAIEFEIIYQKPFHIKEGSTELDAER